MLWPVKTESNKKHAIHTCLRYLPFFSNVCLVFLPSQVQMDFKELLLFYMVCILLSKFITTMPFCGSFIPGVIAVQCHSPRALIPPHHPTPSNGRNVWCTCACTGVKKKMRDKDFLFSFFAIYMTPAVSLPVFSVGHYFTLTFASTLSCPQKTFGIKDLFIYF